MSTSSLPNWLEHRNAAESAMRQCIQQPGCKAGSGVSAVPDSRRLTGASGDWAASHQRSCFDTARNGGRIFTSWARRYPPRGFFRCSQPARRRPNRRTPSAYSPSDRLQIFPSRVSLACSGAHRRERVEQILLWSGASVRLSMRHPKS